MSINASPFMPGDRHGARMSAGPLGWVAGLAFALFACVSPPLSMGQKLELRFFPVLEDQAIPPASITRMDRTLCWDWVRTKVRAPDIVDIDVSLDIADGDAFAPEIYNAATGTPWHKGGALPVGHYETRFCTSLPASVSHEVPVRLRQTVTYNGFLGLWTLKVSLPSFVAG